MAETITVNTSLSEIAQARGEFFAGMGLALDQKRPHVWREYGYPEVIQFEDLYTAYSRGGTGHRAVHLLLDECWMFNPRIKQPQADKETAWETKLKAQLKAVKAWAKLRDLDRRNMIGRFSALIYRVRDGKTLSEPLERATALVELVPLYESQLKVTEWDSDQQSERFGQPVMFQYRSKKPGVQDTQGQPEEWVDVHYTRVQILAEGSAGDLFDGVPLLRAGYNKLIDLEKIGGGSAESYLKNSSRTVTIQYDKESNPAVITADGKKVDVKQAHEDQIKRLNRSIDSAVVTQGATVGTLQVAVADPTGPWTTAANEFAASVGLPFTVLFGQQTGRLASDEDKTQVTKRCKSRQTNELTPLLEELVTRMQAAGVFEAGEFEVEWPDIAAPSDDDRATLLDKLTSSMQKAFAAGLVEPLFDGNELRNVAGYEPRASDGMPPEGHGQEEDRAGEGAKPRARTDAEQ
jgi:uncharacterized protein